MAPGTTDDIACIHGVKAIATIALLIAHKFLPVAVMPYTNRLKITEVRNVITTTNVKNSEVWLSVTLLRLNSCTDFNEILHGNSLVLEEGYVILYSTLSCLFVHINFISSWTAFNSADILPFLENMFHHHQQSSNTNNVRLLGPGLLLGEG